jgi:NitT/TauT family transport system substrate-binding protein
MLNRRDLIGRLVRASAGAAAVPALFASRAAFAADNVVHIANVPIEPTADLFYADEQGFLKGAGLIADIQVLANGQNFIGGVTAGTFNLAPSTIPAIALARERGIMIKLVAPQAISSTQSPANLLMVTRDSPLKTARDLNGKTVACSGLNNLATVALHAWLVKNGADVSTVKLVELPIPAMTEALQAQRIDAAVMSEPFITAGKSLRSIGSPYEAIAPRFMTSGWFASDDWLAKNGDTARSFAAAMSKAHAWANTNAKGSIDIFERVTKISNDLASTMTRTVWGSTLDPQLIQPVLDIAASSGMLPRPMTTGELVWQ